MGEFNSFSDAAFQLKTEGEKITLSFKQGVPNSSQGTVEWNIPTPAAGCTNGSIGAYSGMVILLSTEPLNSSNIPQDGTVYVADPTADFDLHAGDKINNAIVIGAIYECETKNQGGTLTTSLVISNLQSNTPYYVGGYAVDCQYRYHSDGVRAYSDSYGLPNEPDNPAKQVITIDKDGINCIVPTDGTSLVPGTIYEFDVIVDTEYPTGAGFKTAQMSIDGINAGTYQQLVDEINAQLLLIDNPPQSPIAPNTGALYWDSSINKLYKFDGTTHTELSVIIESSDPTIISAGEYWLNTSTNILYVRGPTGSPLVWNQTPFISTPYDPTAPIDGAFWFDQTTARQWTNISWCDKATIISNTDPDACPILDSSYYWYDENTLTLNHWNTTTLMWDSVVAVSWTEAPNLLSSGTFWFDLNTDKLFIRSGSPLSWVDISTSTFIQDTTPTAPADQSYWYAPTTEILKQWNATSQLWTTLSVLVWPGDPTNLASCELWWRTTDNALFVWEAVNSQWDQVTNFSMSLIDPSAAPVIVVDTVWYNPTTNVLSYYDGSTWVTITDYIAKSTDPTTAIIGDVWFDGTTYYEWVTSWVAFNPIESLTDPTMLASQTYWFDTSINALYERNGSSWISISYSSAPLTPIRGSNWYDSSNKTLYEWSGTAWVLATPVAHAYVSSCGITFETTQTGSNTVIIVPAPSNYQPAAVCYTTGYADFADGGLLSGSTTCTYAGTNGTKGYPARVIPSSVFLWDNVTPSAGVNFPIEGSDGKLGTASYDVIGVGTDGTPDERRELIDSLYQQLGAPSVEVELTHYQMNTAVQKALETFRAHSGMAYKRGFYFLDIQPQQQSYKMTNRRIGYHKIVEITAAYRMTSAFLSTAHGGGVYGQVVLQHLYNMGTYDLTSYHLVSQYVEQLEHLFATRLVFDWNEHERQLNFYQSFTRTEQVLLDCSIERTEQDILVDRYTKSWIEKFALAEAMIILSQIRGKYASLPGAGGGVSLNASDLLATAEAYKTDLMDQLDNYLVDNPDEYGMGSTITIG